MSSIYNYLEPKVIYLLFVSFQNESVANIEKKNTTPKLENFDKMFMVASNLFRRACNLNRNLFNT